MLNARDQHTESLYRVGEYSMFYIMWDIQDHNAGLVARCSRCYHEADDIEAEINKVYKQTNEHHCPVCYGTTFEGGFKAKLIRPAMWDFGEYDEQEQRRGVVLPQNAGVQSTFDFRMDTGDYILRADGTRWIVASLSANHLRTGFGYPQKSQTVLGFNYGNVRREDPSDVSYILPPVKAEDLTALLDVRNRRFPVDFSASEILRMPLKDILDGAPRLTGFPGDDVFPSNTLFPDEVTYP